MTLNSAWQQIQRSVGTRLDGDPGMLTARAVASKLGLELKEPTDFVPRVHSSSAWPMDNEAALTAFYGRPCDESQHALNVPPYPLFMDGTPLAHIRVHTKISHSVERALAAVLAHYGEEAIRRLRLNSFDGAYNCRPIRGGSRQSVHAWAAALDFNAADNTMSQNHTSARFARPEYIPWFEIWESEGATSLGRARDFDWMHIQFANLP